MPPSSTSDAPARPESRTLLLPQLARAGRVRDRLPLAAALSIFAHGTIAVGLGSASAAEHSAPTVLATQWVEVTLAEPPTVPEVQPATPPAPEPAKPIPPAARRPRTPTAASEPARQPESEVAQAAQPAAPERASEPETAIETHPAQVDQGAPAEQATLNAIPGTALATGSRGATLGTLSAVAGTEPGPSDADRHRAQSRYVHSLEDLIRAHTRYPRAAARAGLQGRVVLGLRIAPDGRLTGLRVASSSGHDLLDDAALEAAREIGRLPPPPPLAALSDKDEVHVGVVYVVR